MPFAARSRSASRQTIAGSLPPSSRTTGVRFFAAAAMTFRPVATLPVKTILPTRGSSTSAAATASSDGDDVHDAVREARPSARARPAAGRPASWPGRA